MSNNRDTKAALLPPMSAPLIMSALWLLCMFAAVTHGAQPTKLIDRAVMLSAAMLTLILTHWVSPQPGWVGILIALSAIWQLLRGVSTRGLAMMSGFYAGLAAALYVQQGMPIWLAALLCVGLSLGSAVLAKHNAGFVSPRLRQQALMGLTWAAPCIAATPSVMAGWQSAQALNRTMDVAINHTVPAWTWQFVVCALVLGLLHGLWGRK